MFRFPNTTGVSSNTAHKSRHTAVTAGGAAENLTSMDDNAIPKIPVTSTTNGRFSNHFILKRIPFKVFLTILLGEKPDVNKRTAACKYCKLL